MGLVCGLGILTRFEGYLLTLAAATGLLIISVDTQKAGKLKKAISVTATSMLIAFLTALPWLIYRNPLTSTYLDEPMGRRYDLETLIIYAVSYVFVLGIIPAGSLIIPGFLKRTALKIPDIFRKYPHITIFIVIESALTLVWTAAIPRLFIPIIPFLIIWFVKIFDRYFNQNIAFNKWAGYFAVILTVIYIVAQNHLRLQFLGPNRIVFPVIIIVSVICTLSIIIKNKKLFLASSVISLVILSASTIYMHKDIYRTIKEMAVLSSRETQGKYIHNDTSGIINWYLPTAEYKNLDDKKLLTSESLIRNGVDYVIITNEHNPNLDIDLKKRPYLSLVSKSEQETGGKMFFTWLIKVII
jgi:hypothetical protein